MGIGFESVLARVEETTDINIRSAFVVHHLDFSGVVNANTNFEFFRRSFLNVPNLLYIFRFYIKFVYFCPELQLTLGNC